MISFDMKLFPKQINSEGLDSQLDGQTLFLYSSVLLLTMKKFAAEVCDWVFLSMFIHFTQDSSDSALSSAGL